MNPQAENPKKYLVQILVIAHISSLVSARLAASAIMLMASSEVGKSRPVKYAQSTEKESTRTI